MLVLCRKPYGSIENFDSNWPDSYSLGRQHLGRTATNASCLGARYHRGVAGQQDNWKLQERNSSSDSQPLHNSHLQGNAEQCSKASISPGNQKYHDTRVLPYINMTLKGWIWYQGENDMHGVHGNSYLGYGYGCLAQRLVQTWRQLWSTEPDTTDPLAPFGFAALLKNFMVLVSK